MTSQAKINANRHNAEKSTGPKSEEGKATVSQNAVTHGLTSRYDVLSCEDPAEYQQHRQTILAELEPDGDFETLLVERIVSLSWRMRRADRLQGAAMEYLFTAEDRRGHLKGDPASGQVYRLTSSLVRDCANYRVVERLSLYEKRLETSYNKAMAEFTKQRKMRQAERAGLKPAPTTNGERKPNGDDDAEGVHSTPHTGGETKPNAAQEAENRPDGVEIAADCAEQSQVPAAEAAPLLPDRGPVEAQQR